MSNARTELHLASCGASGRPDTVASMRCRSMVSSCCSPAIARALMWHSATIGRPLPCSSKHWWRPVISSSSSQGLLPAAGYRSHLRHVRNGARHLVSRRGAPPAGPRRNRRQRFRRRHRWHEPRRQRNATYPKPPGPASTKSQLNMRFQSLSVSGWALSRNLVTPSERDPSGCRSGCRRGRRCPSFCPNRPRLTTTDPNSPRLTRPCG